MTTVLRTVVGTCGEWFIAALIRLCGRRHERREVTWLHGPIGGATIGDRPYEEIARAEHLSLERLATTGELDAGGSRLVADEGFYTLDAPLVRITTPHIPLPSAAALEDLAIPSVERIVETVKRRLDEAR